MPILFRTRADPFSPRAQQGGDMVPLLARSHAGLVLESEMRRYCAGLVRGRSFLISGHRGSGKTTMVDNAVLTLQQEAADGRLQLKPLPVYLQGPTLFAPEPAPEKVKPAAFGAALVSVNVSSETAAVAAVEKDNDGDSQMNLVLIQVVQALHLAVGQEYCESLHRRARYQLARRPAAAAADLVELAARFQIELTEAPPPQRLHEFWRQAGLLDDGLLFGPGHQRGKQQGMRELVALVGINHVHQRISGKLSEMDQRASAGSKSVETSVTTTGSKWAETVRPLSAVLAGTAVAATGGSAQSPGWAAVLGLLTALGALFIFNLTSVSKSSQERKLDRTFVPDLTIKTLHRVMPELFGRLARAGLAPVFIVDELDKVDNLDVKIYPLILSLKKLFTELSLTCLLVDRGFYERLHLREQEEKRTEKAA